MKKRKYKPPRGRPPQPPVFKREELICHPNLPTDVHEINPRTIKGKEWWDKVRYEAYAKNDYCCWACAQHISEVGGWLHGHESYKFDYENNTVELEEVVALCVMCHDAIHLGRVQIVNPDLIPAIYDWVREHFSQETWEKWLAKNDEINAHMMTNYDPWWIIIDEKKYNRGNKEGIDV